MEKTINWKKVKKISGIVGNTILWLFVAVSVLMTILVFSAQNSEDGVPSLFGKGMITIESNSMEPTFYEGDLVVIDKIDAEDAAKLGKGAIITFKADLDGDGDTEFNTHRIEIVYEDKNYFTTKGDNNGGVDTYKVYFTDIVGTCDEDDNIRGVGNVIKFLRSSLGFFLCIVLPLILFFLYELYNFIMILVVERAKKKPVSKETEEEIKKRAIEEYLKQQAEAAAAASAPESENKSTEEKSSEDNA